MVPLRACGGQRLVRGGRVSIKDKLVREKVCRACGYSCSNTERWSLHCDNGLRNVGYGDDPNQTPPTPTPSTTKTNTNINNAQQHGTANSRRRFLQEPHSFLVLVTADTININIIEQGVTLLVFCVVSCLAWLETSQRSATAACWSPTVTTLSAAKAAMATKVCNLSRQQRVPRWCFGWHWCCFLCWYHQNCCSSQREQQCW